MKPLVDKEYLLEKYPGKGGWTYARIPEIAQGEQCNSPYPCDYKNICTKSNKFESGSLFE